MGWYGLLPMDRSGPGNARTIALLARGQLLYGRSEEFCTSSAALVTRLREHLTRSQRMVQAFARRKPDVVRALVRQKIRAGRLPLESAPILAGGPGEGGSCAACGGPLKTVQLVMALPGVDPARLRLHADCFVLWDQLRRLSK